MQVLQCLQAQTRNFEALPKTQWAGRHQGALSNKGSVTSTQDSTCGEADNGKREQALRMKSFATYIEGVERPLVVGAYVVQLYYPGRSSHSKHKALHWDTYL